MIDVDPRTKMCVYARKTGATTPDRGVLPEVEMRRTRGHGLGRPGIRRIEAVAERAPANVRFRSLQRHYWERKERFLDPRLPGPTAFAEPKLDWAAEHLALDDTTSLLDVGAGNGTVTWHLAPRVGSAVGLDFSRNLLSRTPDGLTMVQGEASQLPFRDGQFDVVVESNFLHHVSDPVAVLREMRRVSRGRLLLIEPNRWHVPMSVFMAAKRSEWRGLRFDMTYLARLVTAAGLRLVAAAPQGAVYPNMTPPSLLGAAGALRRARPDGRVHRGGLRTGLSRSTGRTGRRSGASMQDAMAKPRLSRGRPRGDHRLSRRRGPPR